ncbi:hypothetical protein [Streptomyces sp. PKU-EA00015]|nr:hypothetical protein [Streptomyces sp. PKU-EA00015]
MCSQLVSACVPASYRNFADSSLPSYDAEAASLLLQRTLAFLEEG